MDSSYEYRKKIAVANGIADYSGTAAQNLKMLDALKRGKYEERNAGARDVEMKNWLKKMEL